MAGEQLRVTEGTELGKRLSVEQELLIGRAAQSDEGKLGDDPEISRRHARVSRGPDGRLTVEDLGSTNGTWVDGHQVPPGAEGVALHNGDWIMLGGLDDLIVIFDSTSLAPAAGREPAGTGAVS